MYIPKYFKNQNSDEVREFIKSNSFAILLTSHTGKIWGSHIPLELSRDMDGNEVLYGHISKANSQLSDFDESKDEVLAIFNGPHAYVSSSWYDHENVPTWNYIAVHVYGKLQLIDDQELLFSLSELMSKYESAMEHPMRLESLSEKTMRQIKGVIGFKIYIKEIQAAYKLSQNRNEEDYQSVVENLEKSAIGLDNEISSIMKNRK